jgi:hypothetical protein
MKRREDRQLSFDLQPRLRVIRGEGQKRPDPLVSRDAVTRVLIEAGADLLLRRISEPRAEAIEVAVNEILSLFDRVDRRPELMPVLEARLADLEALAQETREKRQTRRTR